MARFPCPHCGSRDAGEFSFGGEADRVRPIDPEGLDDAAWTDFVYNRTNAEGWGAGLWYHVGGCRRWLRVERNTLTHEISGVRDAAGR